MADADFCCPMFPVYRSERLRKGRSRRVFIAPRGGAPAKAKVNYQRSRPHEADRHPHQRRRLPAAALAVAAAPAASWQFELPA